MYARARAPTRRLWRRHRDETQRDWGDNPLRTTSARDHLNMYCSVVWPSHNIVFANIVWCMAYTRELMEGSYIAR